MSLTSALPSADMPRSMVWLFANASGLSVANVYYAQPLLDALANDFGISHAAVGGVVTATQIGCALALLLVVPLGDKVDRCSGGGAGFRQHGTVLFSAAYRYACDRYVGHGHDAGADRLRRQRRVAP